MLKMIATGGFLTALECIKFVFDLGSARTPLGELSAPKTPSWFKRALLLKEEKVGEGRGKREGK